MPSLLPFIEWCEGTAVAVAIRDSVWLFPAIESVHLLALALLGGAVLLVDLRLLGAGLRQQSPRELARDMEPWLLTGLFLMVVSGVLMFVSEARKCYESPLFQLKMLFLLLAVAFALTVRRRVIAGADGTAMPTWRAPSAALVSIALWSVVGLMGRGIGFW